MEQHKPICFLSKKLDPDADYPTFSPHFQHIVQKFKVTLPVKFQYIYLILISANPDQFCRNEKPAAHTGVLKSPSSM